jgi:CAAX protease family protein
MRNDLIEMTSSKNIPYQFFVVTFIWAWLLWLPLVLAGLGILPIGEDLAVALTIPITILAAFGPAVGAFYCLRTQHGKGAIRQYLRGLMDLRLGAKAWLVPIVVFGGRAWLAWLLPELWGEPRLAMLLPSIWVFPPYILLMVFLGGGQEELGWRGYILDPMEARLGPWLGNIVLGVIWAVWHLPLFFIPSTSQTFMPFAGFVLLTIGYSWFLSWVRHVSGKRTLAGLLAHGWANAFIPLFPTVVMVEGAAQPRFWVWASLTFMIGFITMLLRSRKTG